MSDLPAGKKKTKMAAVKKYVLRGGKAGFLGARGILSWVMGGGRVGEAWTGEHVTYFGFVLIKAALLI